MPAREAKMPLVDRIFARVGASDNIARGQSTFMVEMQETANILHTATSRSLVVLDEIGRGTATFDGLSIAWAVAEHLATNPRIAAQDALRHALPRADRSRRRDARRRQLPRRGARVEGRHHLPAQDRARPIRSQLRHPGRAARRACRPPSSTARARSCRRSSATSSRAAAGRRSAARRPSPSSSSGCFSRRRRRRPRCEPRSRPSTSIGMTPLEALTPAGGARSKSRS